ncbi:MAG: hypothetical protein EXX96DRAFT_583516 [Benjaminiella poitrasii]|nr:MAG: hypothetical protein EXX96DRAFT_583516 [Benjaminiella poitrasii]
MLTQSSLLFTSALLLFASSLVNASGQIAQVIDATDFCIFLPPSNSTNRNIADTEWNANAFCLGTVPLATGAEKLPTGFITSAHYVKTDTYVQVTGQMDYTKAKLNKSDQGGQYDIKAPIGSSCTGWSYYVNLVEPISNTYCIRCCNDTKTCNRGISEKGCAHIIPGDYSGPGSTSNITTVVTSTTKTTTVRPSTVSTTGTPTTTQNTTTGNSSNNANTTNPKVTAQGINNAHSNQRPIISALGLGILLTLIIL